MEELWQQIKDHKKEIEAYEAADTKAVEEFRIKYLGTKGIVRVLMGEMKNVPAEKKKEAGQLLNEFKQYTEERFESLKSHSPHDAALTTGIDLTLPGDPMPL